MITDIAEARPVQGSPFSFARVADRWIWGSMAALFFVIVLAGFIPDSIQKIQAVQANQRPPFPWFLHIHAVAMGAWMLLLLAQTILIGTGRRHWHVWLGVSSVVLAPLVFAMMVVMAGSVWARRVGSASAEVSLASISRSAAFVLTAQGRAIVLFSIFFLWAFRTRRTNPDTHKRMMLLATWVTIDAAIDRIPGSGELGTALGLKAIGLTSRDDIPHFWMLVVLVPALLYDLLRRGRIHYAWLVGLAMFLPFAVLAHYLESGPTWWQQFIAGVTGRI